MSKKKTWFIRGLSFLLMLTMVFSMLPLSTFAETESPPNPNNPNNPNNPGIGGGAGGGVSSVPTAYPVGNWFAQDPYDSWEAMRFSLYFAETGGTLETLEDVQEAEANGELNYVQYGETINVLITDRRGSDNITNRNYFSSDLTVFDRMAENLMTGNDDMMMLIDYSTFVPISSIGFTKTFPDLYDYNGRAAGSRWNEYFLGVSELNDETRENVDLTQTMIIVNKILEGTGLTVTEDNYKQGILFDTDSSTNDSVKKIGVYKLYFEPIGMFTTGKTGNKYNSFLMTMRDAIAYWNAHPNDTFTGTKNGESHDWDFPNAFSSYLRTVANSVYLITDEPIINMEAIDGVSSVGMTPGKDMYDGGGVGVIIGFPGLYQIMEIPDIIKTFVEITKVDPDGTVHYQKALDSTIEKTPFYTDGHENLTTLALFEQIEYPEATRTAVLNDVFTTPHDLVVTKDTEWVDTDLIDNAGVELETNSADIAGYKFGMVTGSDLFISGVVGVTDINERVYVAYDKIAEYAQKVVDLEGAFADQTFYFREARALGQDDSVITVTNAVEYTHHMTNESSVVRLTEEEIKGLETQYNLSLVRAGIVDEETGQVVKVTEEYAEMLKQQTGAEVGLTTFANTIVLRYILKPNPSQVNIVRYYKQDWKTKEVSDTPFEVVVETPVDLDITGTTVNIQLPTTEPPENAEDPEVVEWVTNSVYPVLDLEDKELPEMSDNGLTGTTPNPIPNYPQEPLIHNLYVEWKVIVPEPPPIYGDEDVPEWRLSKYVPSIVTDSMSGVDSATMSFTLRPDRGHAKSTLNPSGTYNFVVINPNGRQTNGTNTPANMNMETIGSVPAGLGSEYAGVTANKWFHSRAFVYGGDSDSISHNDTRTSIDLDGNLNMIKSYDSGSIVVANWLVGTHHTNNIKEINDYAIKSNNIPAGYSGGNEYIKVADLRMATYNTDTYVHQYGVYRHSFWFGCRCYTKPESFSPSGVTYRTAKYNLDVSFARYVQKDTDGYVLTDVESMVDEQNGMTSIKYQIDDRINIYPEVGMLFDTDNNEESIRWVIGDEARVIQPVVWQTLQHKVYVVPASVGTSVATDTRALSATNTLAASDNTARGKQTIYKGAGVNTNFRLYRDDAKKNVALLTVKTYALDFNDSTPALQALKSAWGNSSYNSYAQHGTLLNILKDANNNKADITEKLFVDSNPYGQVEYTGADKKQMSSSYNLINYGSNYNAVGDNKGDAVEFEHKLLIRGGSVIGVIIQDRNATGVSYGSPIPIANLKAQDEALYNALVGMNLYDEGVASGNRNNTVLRTFEHQPTDSKLLDEPKYATDLAAARLKIDGIATPDKYTVHAGESWYSEDTTVLIIKEYVSNYEVPSTSVSDKLSMTISDKLKTPTNKAEFFKEIGKGYTYLKYNLDFKGNMLYSTAEDFNAYFEYSSLPTDTLGFGVQGVDYLVPNVSITDTTRLN